MNENCLKKITKFIGFLLLIIFCVKATAQQSAQKQTIKPKPDFWQHVQFGGGLGISIGSGFTDITIAPSAIYNVNPYWAIGSGLQGSYISQKNYYSSGIYGISIISLFNPMPEIQLSLEIEEVRVNSSYQSIGFSEIKNNFWNTGLFVGAGYKIENVTLGVRYNLLFNKDKNVYSDALMPFVRAYF